MTICYEVCYENSRCRNKQQKIVLWLTKQFLEMMSDAFFPDELRSKLLICRCLEDVWSRLMWSRWYEASFRCVVPTPDKLDLMTNFN